MVQLGAQQFLAMAEKCNSIAFWDIEATSLSGDYGSILCCSIRPWKGPIKMFTVDKVGEDKILCEQIRDCLQSYDIIVGFYSKMFDFRMLQARLLLHESEPIKKIHHVDLCFTLRASIKTSRSSQAHYLNFLGTSEQKMSVGANVWNQCLDRNNPEFKIMVGRCNSDTAGLKSLYTRVKHLIGEVTR